MSNKIAPYVFIVGAGVMFVWVVIKFYSVPVSELSIIITGRFRFSPRATICLPSDDIEHPVISVIALVL